MIVFSRDEESDVQEVDGRLVDVFVNEQIRRCVTFLYEDVPGTEDGTVERVAVGTAFLVSKSLDDSDLDVHNGNHYPDRYAYYLVTAGHIISDSPADTIFVRLNRDSTPLDEYWECGPIKDIPTHKNEWIEHPREGSTDVRVYRLKMPVGRFAIRAMPFSTLTTKIYAAREGIGSGDEVFYIGLFTGHPGEGERVEPVIRFGNISLMKPFEKVKVELTKGSEPTPIEAYLVEARSYGGESGSPVLLYWPPLVRGQREAELAIRLKLPLILGLVQGGYDSDSGGEMGIAIVIPADKIRETIMQKKFADERKQLIEKTDRHKAKNAGKPVARSSRPQVEFTDEDMTNALRKAFPRPSESESGSDET